MLDVQVLPPYLAKEIDAVRVVGNNAAHPTKNDITGEIVDVTPGEAEATIDAVESLLEFCFAAPARQAERAAALDEKLTQAGQKLPRRPER